MTQTKDMHKAANKNSTRGEFVDRVLNQRKHSLSVRLTASLPFFLIGTFLSVISLVGNIVGIVFIVSGNLGMGLVVGGISFILHGVSRIMLDKTVSSLKTMNTSDEVALTEALVEFVEDKYRVKVTEMSQEQMTKFTHDFFAMLDNKSRMTVAFYEESQPKQKQIGTLAFAEHSNFILLDGFGKECATRANSEESTPNNE